MGSRFCRFLSVMMFAADMYNHLRIVGVDKMGLSVNVSVSEDSVRVVADTVKGDVMEIEMISAKVDCR